MWWKSPGLVQDTPDLGVQIMTSGQVSASFSSSLFQSGPVLFYVLTPLSHTLSPHGDQIQSHIPTGLFKLSENKKENILFLIIQVKSLALVWTNPTTLVRGIWCPDWLRAEMHAPPLGPLPSGTSLKHMTWGWSGLVSPKQNLGYNC